VHLAPPEVVAAQIEAVMEDFAVAAIKIGMLGSPEIVGVVAEALGSPSPRPSPAGGRRRGASLLPQSPSRDGRLSTPYAGEGGPKGRMRGHSFARTLMDETGSCAGGRWRGLFQERGALHPRRSADRRHAREGVPSARASPRADRDALRRRRKAPCETAPRGPARAPRCALRPPAHGSK